jgi:uncharacterized lipoprotein YehR (DUF1307 family)
MKYLLFLIFFFILNCENPGTIKTYDEGNIEGHKIRVVRYYYDDMNGSVLVAFIDNVPNSLTYKDGKIQETVIQVNGKVLMENDSLIIIRKQ